MKNTILPIVFGLLALASCGERSTDEAAWTPIALAELDVAQQAQYAKALEARNEMFGALMKTLSGELASSGPAAAIGVCREAAPGIARDVAENQGVEIGRTSWKLRNPDNAAPAWTEALLAEKPEEERASRGPDGQLGITLPIRLAGPCLACHGAPDALADDVRDALASRYPEDQATGFAEGDLRGWFWVAVPAQVR